MRIGFASTEFIIISIALSVFHILFWHYYISKKIQYLLMAIITMILSIVVNYRAGAFLIIVSVASFLCIVMKSKIVRYCRVKGIYDQARDMTTFLCALLIILGVGFAILYQITRQEKTFQADVLNTYINNLCGTNRFSAIPFLEISMMPFIYLHFVIFMFARKRNMYTYNIFCSITITLLIYIFVIGMLYAYRWSADNLATHGEYMTGFGDYMLLPSILIYVFWGYIVIGTIISHVKKLQGSV